MYGATSIAANFLIYSPLIRIDLEKVLPFPFLYPL